MPFQPGFQTLTQGFGTAPAGVQFPHIDLRAPTTTDILYPIGQRWIDRSGLVEYVLMTLTSLNGVTSATWVTLGGTSPSFTNLTVTGNETVGGTLGVTGDLTVAGNILMTGAAKQIRMEGGAATDFIGTATLTAGTTGAIANTNIAATDLIFPTRISVGASTALGLFSYTISAGASFTITVKKPADATTETGDVSTVGYVIIRMT